MIWHQSFLTWQMIFFALPNKTFFELKIQEYSNKRTVLQY